MIKCLSLAVFTAIFLFQFEFIFGQKNYYKTSDNKILSEEQFKSIFDVIAKNQREGYIVIPTIYHKVIRKDSIINYVTFEGKRKTGNTVSKFEPVFRQDSLFLLLDKRLPEFTLMDLDGKLFNFSRLLGKPTLINLWNVHCGPCIAEFPFLDQLKEKYGDKMNFISITEDDNDYYRLSIFLKKKPFHFYHLQDGGAYINRIKLGAIPRNIFIDKNGIVRDIEGGLPFEKDPKTGEMAIRSSKPFEPIIERLLKM